jgi:hypothetical protein
MREKLGAPAGHRKKNKVRREHRHHPMRAPDGFLVARHGGTQRTAKKEAQKAAVLIGKAAARLAAV